MKRRNLIKTAGAISAAASLAATNGALADFSYSAPITVNKKLPVPKAGKIKVAFVIDEGVQMIDFAGPWEVFQDVWLPVDKSRESKTAPAFDLFTVAKTQDPVTATGGMQIVPKYSIGNTPDPNMIVIPHFAERNYTAAQSTSAGIERSSKK